MATNIERLKKDLEELIQQGHLLDLAMRKEIAPDYFKKGLRKALKDSNQVDVDEALKRLPDFKTSYEAWYSESLAVLRQLLPDRIANFVALYEKPKARKLIQYGNYVIQDYLQGLTIRDHLGEIKLDPSAALPQYRQQVAILQAAKRRFDTSLFEIRQLVQADLFDSEIEVARELLKGKFLRPAGSIAGVILEKHLRQVCIDHAIKITKTSPGIGDLNELLKTNSVIDVPQWRHISILGDSQLVCAQQR
jgi:hypothetical protein